MEVVIRVVPREDCSLELWFDTGDHRLFDARSYLNRGCLCACRTLLCYSSRRSLLWTRYANRENWTSPRKRSLTALCRLLIWRNRSDSDGSSPSNFQFRNLPLPRRPRFCQSGVPLHIIQRSNNRQACFFAGEDYQAYLGWLSEFAAKNGCQIHAYALRSNHVPLLLSADLS